MLTMVVLVIPSALWLLREACRVPCPVPAMACPEPLR